MQLWTSKISTDFAQVPSEYQLESGAQLLQRSDRLMAVNPSIGYTQSPSIRTSSSATKYVAFRFCDKSTFQLYVKAMLAADLQRPTTIELLTHLLLVAGISCQRYTLWMQSCSEQSAAPVQQ